MCNDTHFLSVIGKDVDETDFQKIMCNDTYRLSMIGKDVRGLPFTKCVMSLTSYW
jgi:hypothetical protein